MSFINKAVAGMILAMIYIGIISSPEQLTTPVNSTELQYLAGAMEIENGNETDKPYDDMRRLLLTGSVIINRIKSDKWYGSSVEQVIMAKDGGYIQYADVTRKGFKTVQAKERTILLAKYILIYGPICPGNVVYQGQSKNGSGIYDSIPVKGDKNELFCFE